MFSFKHLIIRNFLKINHHIIYRIDISEFYFSEQKKRDESSDDKSRYIIMNPELFLMQLIFLIIINK
jgi:hypothetical protein